MTIYSSNIELFQQGKELKQIYFLDNFYKNVSIEKEAEDDIAKLLTLAINDSFNIYVKRSAFIILCDLTLVKKITNKYSALGHIHDFLSSTESILQTIALKYLAHFPEFLDNNTIVKLKMLSDNDNGEIASQAYLCLGLFQLSSGIIKNDTCELITNLTKSRSYFEAATQVTENLVDADFYLLIIDWIELVLTNDSPSIQKKFNELKKNLQVRRLYEFEDSDLELDFMIFKIIEQIKASFEVASTSKEWIIIQPQVQTLLNISIEIEKIRNICSKNQVFTEKILVSTFENLETIIYNMHLVTEKQRFQALKLQSIDQQLINFVDYLLSLFPNSDIGKTENLELLALLSEHMGSEKGLELYLRICEKEVTLEKGLSEFLRKNKINQLPNRTGSILGQEVLFSLMSEIDQNLPNYPLDKREAFFNIVEEVIRYTKATFIGHEKKLFQFLFCESENGKGKKALEQDLQDSMISYFGHSKIADGLDHEKARFVDGGRIDIVYKRDLITIPIELKKSIHRPDKETLETNYIAQAQTYTAGYDQLGIFILLELSDKSKEAPPNFKDWFKVHHLSPSTNQKIEYPDYIISVIIPGNRTSPSAKSTYK